MAKALLTSFLSEVNEEKLALCPPMPEEPLPSDCCGSGCRVCVNDLYDAEVQSWIKTVKEILSGHRDNCAQLPHEETNTQCFQLSKRAFAKFQITSVFKESYDSYIYRFNLNPKNGGRPSPGEHLIARLELLSGESITREYTPITDITAIDYFDVLIKVYEDGKFTRHVKEWKVGDMVEWKGPFGRFDYKANEFTNIIMIAGGTGITPMIPITQQILSNEDDETRLHLYYSNKRYEDILLKNKLGNFQDYWNFQVVYILTRVEDVPAEKSKFCFRDKAHFGRINQEYLMKELKNLQGEGINKFLVCGSTTFEEKIKNALVRIGISENNILTF